MKRKLQKFSILAVLVVFLFSFAPDIVESRRGFGEDGVSVAAGVIAAARVGGVPHRGVPIVALAVRVSLELRHERPAVRAALIAEIARQEAPAHVPVPQHARDRLRQVVQKQRPQQIEARLRPGTQRAASNGR